MTERRDGEMVAASGSKPERNNGNQEGAADTLGTSVARAGSSPAPDTTSRVMRMHYEVTLEGDFAVVHERAQDAVSLLSQRHAARRIADFAAKLSRFSFENKLTNWFDWDRLRVNIAHKVEPSIVKWRTGESR